MSATFYDKSDDEEEFEDNYKKKKKDWDQKVSDAQYDPNSECSLMCMLKKHLKTHFQVTTDDKICFILLLWNCYPNILSRKGRDSGK